MKLFPANVCCLMLPLVNVFRNREIEFGFSLGDIKTVFKGFQLRSVYEHKRA